MKKSKISLSIILALLLTFCFSTVSYADTIKTVPHHGSEQQGIVVPMGILCQDCKIGTMVTSSEYSPYLFKDADICTTHTHCTIETWTRTVTITRQCNYCGRGNTSTYEQPQLRHISTLQ